MTILERKRGGGKVGLDLGGTVGGCEGHRRVNGEGKK